MTLEEAIEEVKRIWKFSVPDDPLAATIFNAVASGQIVPKADADLAVAEALGEKGVGP
jgi:hypothetical protein